MIHVSPLRRDGLITPDMTSYEVAFFPGEAGEVRQVVGLQHLRFPAGGGWSFFVCPTCNVRRRKLRVMDGRIVCLGCDGLIDRRQAHANDIQVHLDLIARIEAQLNNPRVKHRRPLMTALRRAQIRVRRMKLDESYAP